MQKEWATQVRELLARAAKPVPTGWECLDAMKVSIDQALQDVPKEASARPYPIERKHLMAQIGLKMKHYGLQDEAQAFIYATGAAVLQELDNEQLAALNCWLAKWVEGMHYAVDSPFAPPGR